MSNIFTTKISNWAQKNMLWCARIALFVVYFLFGILKVVGLSPAGPLVHALFDKTIYFLMPFDTFYILFALYEVLIGILFLFPKLTKLALALMILHLVTTILPLICLPHLVWQAPFIPTLEGQYIIKNVLILALGIVLLAHTSAHASDRKIEA